MLARNVGCILLMLIESVNGPKFLLPLRKRYRMWVNDERIIIQRTYQKLNVWMHLYLPRFPPVSPFLLPTIYICHNGIGSSALCRNYYTSAWNHLRFFRAWR